MNDEQNPYRFAGDASREIGEAPGIPRRLTLRDLRSVDRGRRLLGAFCVLVCGAYAFVIAAVALAPSPQVHAGPAYLPYVHVAVAANAVLIVGMLCLFVVGSVLMPLLGRRFGGIETLSLLVPGLNAIVAILLANSAVRLLESRGVRVGWIASDFSQARVDPSYWRPRIL